MLAINIPTPEEINAYAAALTAVAVALGGIGTALIVFIQKLRVELRANTVATQESTAAHKEVVNIPSVTVTGGTAGTPASWTLAGSVGESKPPAAPRRPKAVAKPAAKAPAKPKR